MPRSETVVVAELATRARALAELGARSGGRRILGIAGAPGAGKSTLTQQLVHALGPQLAVVVPLDGFHLANEVLTDLGWRDRKGAPDTFDAAGYTALLRRIRDPGEVPVYAPRFVRDIEESFGSAIAIAPDVPLVITEGNYLLLDDAPWALARAEIDELWYLDVDDDLRLDRLIRRHRSFGRSEAEAEAWSRGTDQRNAELVASSAHRADRVIRLLD